MASGDKKHVTFAENDLPVVPYPRPTTLYPNRCGPPSSYYNQVTYGYHDGATPDYYKYKEAPSRYHHDQQPISYHASTLPNSYRGSTQASDNNFQIVSTALAGTGRPVQYIHNDGTAEISDTYPPDYNILFYNGPNAVVKFVGSDCDSGSKDSIQHFCKHCGKGFASKQKRKRHDKDHPLFCSQHNICHNSWTKHNEKRTHTKCPLSGCQKEFNSDAKFREHFSKKH